MELFNLFGRRSSPAVPIDRRNECGSRRIGELAVCISDRWANATGFDPQCGDVLRVVAVEDFVVRGTCLRWLHFAGKPANICWVATAFRKPVQDESGADAEVAARIKAARPATAPGHERIDA